MKSCAQTGDPKASLTGFTTSQGHRKGQRKRPEGRGRGADPNTHDENRVHELDRPELLHAVKETSRGTAAPTQGDWSRFRRTARFLLKQPRLTQKFQWQFAGCARRRSTSGSVAFLCAHCFSIRSKTKSVIATSTADAELFSLCSATSDAVETSSLSKLSVGSIVVDRMSIYLTESTCFPMTQVPRL